MKLTIINTRDDFAKWVVERINLILSEQASDLATAASNGIETEIAEIAETAQALCQAIVDAMLDAFDSLAGEE